MIEDTVLTIAAEILKIEIGELVLQKMRSGNEIPVSRCTITFSEIDALFNDIKKDALTQPEEEPKCSNHPDAPHGFCRDASHSAGRYVCECEGWQLEWQGLSDDEISKVIIDEQIPVRTGKTANRFARVIEQALKEKNA
jgi:hypothetical protein